MAAGEKSTSDTFIHPSLVVVDNRRPVTFISPRLAVAVHLSHEDDKTSRSTDVGNPNHGTGILPRLVDSAGPSNYDKIEQGLKIAIDIIDQYHTPDVHHTTPLRMNQVTLTLRMIRVLELQRKIHAATVSYSSVAKTNPCIHNGIIHHAAKVSHVKYATATTLRLDNEVHSRPPAVTHS